MLGPEVRLRGGSLVSAACHEQRLPEPYALWSEVLRSVRRLPVKSTRQWRELSSLDPSLERASDELTRGGSKVRLLEELADFLRLAAQQRPLFILLDDMQWADDASWDALEHLVPQLESERIVLALTIRTDEQSDDALERWSRLSSRPHHDEIRMTRLTRDDVKRWVEGAMSHGEAGRDLLAYLYRHTEGNPLHVVHLLRDLEESGHLTREGERWRWSDLQELPTERHLRRGSRGDGSSGCPTYCIPCWSSWRRSTASSTRSFSVASAIGTRATRRESVRCLVDARMLTPTYDRDCASYLFSHDELSRVARESLPAERRASIARAGSRRRSPGSEGASHSLIATHYEAAGQSAETHRHARARGGRGARALRLAGGVNAAHRCCASRAVASRVGRAFACDSPSLPRRPGTTRTRRHCAIWRSTGTKGARIPVQAIRLKRMRTLVRMQRGQGARETLNALVRSGR